MKSIAATLFLLLAAMPLLGGQSAPLGTLLSKAYPQLRDNDPVVVVVYLTDKGNIDRFRLSKAQAFVSARSVARRLKVRPAGAVVDERDYPLEASYVQTIARDVLSVRHQLKWFNAVSVTATKSQIETMRRLPFVREIEMVARWKKKPDDEQASPYKESASERSVQGTSSLNYGTSFTQVNQINVPPVHDLGIYGQGIVIGVFDNGFRNPFHQAFDSMKIIATHDFVDHKESVIPNNPNTGFGSHGVWTLSTIGGYWPGELIGPAFKASFILARTENDSSETPIEEDNWARAVEWADSIGVDVTSTSLGYLTFDAPYTSLTAQDMNGHTALITLAADRADSLGIVVVNSAGNEGPGDGTTNTLIAPADGINVITAGAVAANGTRASFSSVGPTTDVPPRIKPDIMAMGVGVKAASSTDTVNYVSVSGTSFSCPLSAGAAALILCAHPSLTPFQVREAMRNTANNASTPNNQYGWGIVNTLAAIDYYGSPRFGHIVGTVFEDRNGDGVKEWGETGVPGIAVHLAGAAPESTFTDTLGRYLFDTLGTGSYTLTRIVPPGWIRTSPLPDLDTISIDSLNSTMTAQNFGIFKLGSIAGSVFADLNSNSIRDGGDTGLAHWKIILSGAISDSTFTDSAGNYSFPNLGPGTYFVSESTSTGWVQSAPIDNGLYTVSMHSGLDSAGLLFGNTAAPTSNFAMNSGWNLLSLPRMVTDVRKATIYPSAISSAFGYSHGYAVIDTLAQGAGFWLKFASPQNVVIPGSLINADTVPLVAGWNLIGALSDTLSVDSIVQQPGGIITSSYFGYSAAYDPTAALAPARGYWVKASVPGVLIRHASAGPMTSARHPRPLTEKMNSIQLSDRAGRSQTLYFGPAGGSVSSAGAFELPPLPPEGAFDARFASQRYVEFTGGTGSSYPLQISSAAYPITVRWNVAGGDLYSLVSDGQVTQMAGAGKAQITKPTGSIAVVSGPGTRVAAPSAFGLDQNYPNPFNPMTDIRYQITEVREVSLTIYDVLGRRVATLVDGVKQPGEYTVRWDASGYPSGVYFYRLTAGAFSSTKKLVIMK